jgi:hypothetical protein
MGEPVGSRRSTQIDFQIISKKKRNRNIGIVVLLSAAVVAAIVLAPEGQKEPPVPVVPTIHPEAIALVDKGLSQMLADTDTAYMGAQSKFDQARDRDTNYSEAKALAGLAGALRSADMQLRATWAKADAEQAKTTYANLEATPRRRRPKGSKKKMAELRVVMDETSTRIESLEKLGATEKQKAQSLLEPHGGADNVRVLSSVGVAKALLGDSQRAGELLGQAKATPADATPSPWLEYLEALTSAATPKVSVFEKLTKDFPKFERAHFELASAHFSNSNPDAARGILQALVGRQPKHEKAIELLARIDTRGDKAEQDKPSKRKKRGRQGKKRRRRKRR